MTWLKLDADIVTNGRVGDAVDDAGPEAALLYVGILALHSKHGSGGVIPASHCSPQRIQRSLVSFGLDDVERSMRACESAGLIEVSEDQSIRVRGMEGTWLPRCTLCKKPNPEPGSGGRCPVCRSGKSDGSSFARESRKSRAPVARESRKSRGRGSGDSCAIPRPDQTGQDSVPVGSTNRASGVPYPSADPSPDPEVLRSLVLVLTKAEWGSSSVQRWRLARRLAGLGVTGTQLRDQWADCSAKGKQPTRLFAYRMKHPESWLPPGDSSLRLVSDLTNSKRCS